MSEAPEKRLAEMQDAAIRGIRTVRESLCREEWVMLPQTRHVVVGLLAIEGAIQFGDTEHLCDELLAFAREKLKDAVESN